MTRRPTLHLAAAAIIVLAASACGSGGSSSPSSSNPAAASPSASPRQATKAADPVVNIEDPSGRNTQLTLSAGFEGMLRQLGVRIRPSGRAELDRTLLVLPITGGNVRAYRPGSTTPPVQGSIEHDGSGMTLRGNDNSVRLSDFEIDASAMKIIGDISVDGERRVSDAPLFSIKGIMLTPLRRTRDSIATLQARMVTLDPGAAPVISQALGASGLKAGTQVGAARVVVEKG